MPMNRGILATCYVRLINGATAESLHDALSRFYAEETFVRVLPYGEVPATRHVRGSNNCWIGVVADRVANRAIVISVIDNLVKAPAGSNPDSTHVGFPRTPPSRKWRCSVTARLVPMEALIRSSRSHPIIDKAAFIAETAVIIGQAEIAADASIWYGCVLRGDGAQITIGPRTNIQDGTVIHVNEAYDQRPEMPTWIGADVTVGHMALLHACTLKDRAFVGMKACVMDGAVVERISCGGRSDTRQGGLLRLWAGSPAKFIRSWTITRSREFFGPLNTMFSCQIPFGQYLDLSQTQSTNLP